MDSVGRRMQPSVLARGSDIIPRLQNNIRELSANEHDFPNAGDIDIGMQMLSLSDDDPYIKDVNPLWITYLHAIDISERENQIWTLNEIKIPWSMLQLLVGVER